MFRLQASYTRCQQFLQQAELTVATVTTEFHASHQSNFHKRLSVAATSSIYGMFLLFKTREHWIHWIQRVTFATETNAACSRGLADTHTHTDGRRVTIPSPLAKIIINYHCYCCCLCSAAPSTTTTTTPTTITTTTNTTTCITNTTTIIITPSPLLSISFNWPLFFWSYLQLGWVSKSDMLGNVGQ